MTSDVVLTAALRQNLLSLQNTQSSIDSTQFRLATGRKINSALDGPSSFFASQALNNRASDLTRLLDGIGQSIQTIQAADNGVTALTSLVEQADSLASSARDALAQGQAEARVVGDVDVSDIDDFNAVSGVNNGDTLVFNITDADGEAVNIGAFGGAAAATATVTINTNDSIDDIIAEINDINLQVNGVGNAVGDQAFEASLDEGGNLQIRTLNGGDFRVDFVTGGDSDAENLALANALGFGNVTTLIEDGGGNNNVEFTALADVAITSFSLFDGSLATPEIAQASTGLDDLEQEDGTAIFAAAPDNVADDFTIRLNGGAAETIELFDGNNALSIQSFVDQINANASLNTQIEASYSETTGELQIRAISADVESIQIGVTDTVTANFGFGLQTLTGGGGTAEESIRLASAAAEIAQLETDYNRVRDQITELVTNGDTAYRGTNLLNGDDLLTTFNEDRSSSLTSNGVDFTSDGLGLAQANFSRTSSVDDSLTQIRGALESIRSFGSTLASDLSIIQTRESFTQNTINTLTEGADKLTIADQNEEGAKLLALQTRQQLGVTSLALASQSQQSILRLF